MHTTTWRLVFGLAIVMISASALSAADFPPVGELEAVEEFPEPLAMFDGTAVTTPEAWRTRRRPELIELFGHYMYGFAPSPGEVRVIEEKEDNCLDGKATMRQITLGLGPSQAAKIHLLLFVPARNDTDPPAPVFIGLNFAGNHATIDDPRVDLPQGWMPKRYQGVVDNRATDGGRGRSATRWPIEMITGRGYAVATIYCGDIDPDRDDFTDGIHPHFYESGQTKPGPHEWGTIAAWAWGLARAVDYLANDRAIDKQRIAVMGHSRLGKTALLAGALDARIALVVANQSGCGGASPSRSPVGEQLSDINRVFPHWFNDTFPQFDDTPQKLPFDQHCLIALCAPRPVLLSNAEEDEWADPPGQFDALKAAEPVYQLLGAGGCDAEEMPPLNEPVLSTLGYNIRPGEHHVGESDWRVFLDFADRHFGRGR